MSAIPKPVLTHDAAPRKCPFYRLFSSEWLIDHCLPFSFGEYSCGALSIKANGLIFVSGQIPADKSGNVIRGSIEECTEAVFVNLASVLKAANSSFNKVLKTTVFLSDMANFARMNSVYEKHFSGHKPARSCVAVRELPKGVDVEIELVALEDTLPGKAQEGSRGGVEEE
ncbi:unnamed protein product [Tuber melanosporum]|uniref:(Perigord truffle) hypothetical protein n=1 Tax=Tuber melanosporum (strain Mel28) TaxID=656061 RepID=D5G8C7_TUBMM|nr:uncharacterized protein GSTUM_00004743001 [Tuber melanosporum]CAZ80770.1 unnamed protein product [Tuber melanosporum]